MASNSCMNLRSMSTSTRAAGVLGMDSMPKCFNLLPAAASCSRVLKMPPLVTRNCPRSGIVCKAQGAANEVLVVTDSSWDSLVVANESPVLVEFWAPWCGPCRMIAPVIDELAKEYAGKLACYKVNTDDCPSIATKCGIRSIPTVLLFKNGEKKESVIGAVPKSTLTATIEKNVE